jgi:hypothetical protein
MRGLVFAQSVGFALYDYGKTGEKSTFHRRMNVNMNNFKDNRYRKILVEFGKLI